VLGGSLHPDPVLGEAGLSQGKAQHLHVLRQISHVVVVYACTAGEQIQGLVVQDSESNQST
jgi:hypothetical protein